MTGGKHEEQEQCNATWGKCATRTVQLDSGKDLPHICGIWGRHRTHACDSCQQPQAK